MSVLGVIIGSACWLGAPAPQSDAPAKAERARWQGSWRIVQMEMTTGQRTARLKFESEEAAVRVKDDRLEITGLNFPYSSGRLTLDPAAQPKRLTLQLLDEPRKGPTVEGAFTRDGDDLELEFPKWPRGKDETVVLRLILKRVK